jgi:hypothetical protein
MPPPSSSCCLPGGRAELVLSGRLQQRRVGLVDARVVGLLRAAPTGLVFDDPSRPPPVHATKIPPFVARHRLLSIRRPPGARVNELTALAPRLPPDHHLPFLLRASVALLAAVLRLGPSLTRFTSFSHRPATNGSWRSFPYLPFLLARQPPGPPLPSRLPRRTFQLTQQCSPRPSPSLSSLPRSSSSRLLLMVSLVECRSAGRPADGRTCPLYELAADPAAPVCLCRSSRRHHPAMDPTCQSLVLADVSILLSADARAPPSYSLLPTRQAGEKSKEVCGQQWFNDRSVPPPHALRL